MLFLLHKINFLISIIMRIEILSRIWIADKKHTKCHIKKRLYIHDYNFWEQDMNTFQTLLDKCTSTIHKIAVHTLEPIILIDHDIHSHHTAYIIIIAYILRYTDLTIQRALLSVQTKTLPFTLNSGARNGLRIFYKKYRKKYLH